MDKLIAEKETKVKVEEEKIENQKTNYNELVVKEQPPIQTEYLNSLENITLADVKRKEDEKKLEEFKIEKEILIQQQFESEEVEKEEEQVCQNIIEKPNYDLIEENKKVVKLQSKKKSKAKSKKKFAGLAIACALGAGAIICVTNAVIIDNMSSGFVQLEEVYKMNLMKYLKNIADLDTTKKSMEIIETYPDEVLNAGEVGNSTNWFDRFCNFIGGIFGG